MADATVLVLWVVAFTLALYLIPRYGLATYEWISAYIATGELADYPVGKHELISLVALTGGYGGLHLAAKLFGRRSMVDDSTWTDADRETGLSWAA